MSGTVRAYIALGSNLGDRTQQIRQAIGLLQAHSAIRLRQISRFHETEPVGIREERDPQRFINAVVGVDTEFSPRELLDACLSIERLLGRERSEQAVVDGYLSRTMDIDILFYDDRVIQEADLEIPHPRLHERSFTLIPLMDIAPQLVHPVLNESVQTLFERLESGKHLLQKEACPLAVTH